MKRMYIEILLPDELAEAIHKWENETKEDTESLLKILLEEKFKKVEQ